MPNLRSDGKPRSAPVGRVKAATRASGSAPALALTRPAGADHTSISRSPLTYKTVAEEPGEACVSKDARARSGRSSNSNNWSMSKSNKASNFFCPTEEVVRASLTGLGCLAAK